MLRSGIYIFILMLMGNSALVADQLSDSATGYQYFNQPCSVWDWQLMAGAGITKLPTDIVEEEINTSPVVYGDFKIGMPLNFSADLYFASNYISNIGTLGLRFNPFTEPFPFSVGVRSSMWFGHVEMESIKLKSYGFLLKPVISAGLVIEDILITSSFEIQWGKMYTYSEDSLLATFKQPSSGYTLRFEVEQPFYGDQLVMIGIGLNYNTFYYQSWLSYSAIKEYLLYPEIYLGFLL
jgi:hypothetical protein